jgi:hypothetical protein
MTYMTFETKINMMVGRFFFFFFILDTQLNNYNAIELKLSFPWVKAFSFSF